VQRISSQGIIVKCDAIGLGAGDEVVSHMCAAVRRMFDGLGKLIKSDLNVFGLIVNGFAAI